MSYYILPKNTNTVHVNPQYSADVCGPYISHSLFQRYNEIAGQLCDMFGNDEDLSNHTLEEAVSIIHPCDFVYSNVPGSNQSVSKLKYSSRMFYDLIEIYGTLNVLDAYTEISTLSTLHITRCGVELIDCFETFREQPDDVHIVLSDISIDNNLRNTKVDFLLFETDVSNYFVSLIQAVIVILRNQQCRGTAVIKIDSVFHKPVSDVLYLLTSLYDKVYIAKPSTSNATTFERYIVCKSFVYNEQAMSYLKLNCLKLIIFLKRLEGKQIHSVLHGDIPCYLKYKLDDLNVIVGQQQLDALGQIVAVYKHKNKDDKIDCLKKNNIHKSVAWCEKHGIPCNKFAEKTNMFLPI